MSSAANTPGPDTRGLFALFPPSEYLAKSETIAADQVPPPYHALLVHPHHMTVTVENHYGEKVDVRVLQQLQGAETYARKILLVTQTTRRVVQFGLVRVHLRFCSDAVRSEIQSGQTPLGRILIDHDVLRRIEPTNFLRITPAAAMMDWFGLSQPLTTYSRQAIIHCDAKPAIELLEIVAPIS